MKMKKQIFIAILAVQATTAGCALAPHYGKLEGLDHISHLTKGRPFGPKEEEDAINQSNLIFGWTDVLTKRSYIELGIGYMWKDQGFTGGPFTATIRAGAKICFNQEKCGE